jgi:hypothetical protein
MLLLVLFLLFLATLVLMVVQRRHIGRLTSFATLLATVMLMIWMQDNGLLPGTRGRYSDDRPHTSLDPPRPAAPVPAAPIPAQPIPAQPNPAHPTPAARAP